MRRERILASHWMGGCLGHAYFSLMVPVCSSMKDVPAALLLVPVDVMKKGQVLIK